MTTAWLAVRFHGSNRVTNHLTSESATHGAKWEPSPLPSGANRASFEETEGPLLLGLDARSNDAEANSGLGIEATGQRRVCDRNRRLAAALTAAAAFLVWGFAMGIIFWRATDYPYFMFFTK